MSYRIVQWSSGNVGQRVIQGIAERDGFELAGLYVYGADKAGRDAGTLAGIDPLGVAATDSVDDILALDADAVIHTPLPSLVYGEDPDADMKTFCQLLESGKNVLTTVGYMYPQVYGPEVMDRLQAACAKGTSSFHGTGANPGWVGDVFPLTMSSLSKRIEQVYTREISNFQFYPSPEVMFDMMGFGKTEEEFAKDIERYRYWLTHLFRENVQMVADGLAVELDEIQETAVRAHAEQDLETAAGLVKKGTIAGQHWEWAGMHKGHKVVVHQTVWRMHESVAPDWPQGDHLVEIKGEGHMRVEFDWSIIGTDAFLATGMHALNAVPYVCAAAPGVQTLIDLPWIVAKGAVRPQGL